MGWPGRIRRAVPTARGAFRCRRASAGSGGPGPPAGRVGGLPRPGAARAVPAHRGEYPCPCISQKLFIPLVPPKPIPPSRKRSFADRTLERAVRGLRPSAATIPNKHPKTTCRTAIENRFRYNVRIAVPRPAPTGRPADRPARRKPRRTKWSLPWNNSPQTSSTARAAPTRAP